MRTRYMILSIIAVLVVGALLGRGLIDLKSKPMEVVQIRGCTLVDKGAQWLDCGDWPLEAIPAGIPQAQRNVGAYFVCTRKASVGALFNEPIPGTFRCEPERSDRNVARTRGVPRVFSIVLPTLFL